MNTDDVQYLDWQWVEEHPESALDLMLKLHSKNAALKEELAPLRETVGVRGDAVTSRDDIAYWCKLMDRAGKADRLERENAALRKLINEPYQFFRFGHKALFPWGKFLDRWCKRAEKLGFKKEAKP